MDNARRTSILKFYLVIAQLCLYNDFLVYAAVTTDCTYDDTQALITYKGDPKGVIAINKEGEECIFDENTATVTFTKFVKFERSTEEDCVFDKSEGMELYTITIQGRKTIAEIQNDGDEEFLVQCSFETYADDVAGATGVEEPVKSPVIISQNAGDTAVSNFTVSVIKINGQPFQNPHVRLGRLIKLRASMTGTANETRFHVTNCKAFSTDMEKSAVLLSEGCGTGFPFANDQGFTLEGLSAVSPSFRMFRVKRTQGVIFKCSFIVCNEHCGPNSCNPDLLRRKREAFQSVTELDYSYDVSSQTDSRQRRSAETNIESDTLYNLTLISLLMGKETNKKLSGIHKIQGGYILDVENKDLIDSSTNMEITNGDQSKDTEENPELDSYVRINVGESADD